MLDRLVHLLFVDRAEPSAEHAGFSDFTPKEQVSSFIVPPRMICWKVLVAVNKSARH
jgi:hypothetical protein